jgi:hypothetical protein
MTETACTHPPTQYFSWFAYDCVTEKNTWVICCKTCHETMKGSAEEYEAYLGQARRCSSLT